MKDSVRFSAEAVAPEESGVLYYSRVWDNPGQTHALGFRVKDEINGYVSVELVSDHGENAVVDPVCQYLCRIFGGQNGGGPREENGHLVFFFNIPKPGRAVSTTDSPASRIKKGVYNCAQSAIEKQMCYICAQA